MKNGRDSDDANTAPPNKAIEQPSVAPTEQLPASAGAATPSESVLSNREESVSAREAITHTREQTADQRDNVAQLREETVYLRERQASSSEEAPALGEDTKADLENHIIMLQQANEHLVISAIQAQIMSEEVQQAKDKMGHMAHYDFLTNLPNRTLLNDRIAQAIIAARRSGTMLAILFLDLDNFKHVNDSLGHATGDQLLQSVACRLRECVRGSDTVSRQGGDEFVVLLAEDRRPENAVLTAEKIIAALAAPHIVAEHELHVTTSIGISVYPMDGKDAETLIKNADTAMYQAKEKGRNNYQFFKQAMNRRAVERQVVEANLRHALARHQFALHYQPKINLITGSITGAEALLRWTHPEWGVVAPERFVPIAEDCGLIVPIGRWVLREACLHGQRWMQAGLNPGSIAVNISALEFRHKDFVVGVRAILRETGLPPSYLELEITESVMMRDVDTSGAILCELKNMGVQLAIDDFGTGYSSLSYLNQFPIDALKIDQSFVQGIGSPAGNDIIVSAVIAMGASLKYRVIAEGVEQQTQLTFLQEQHCTEGQGYFFSRPIAAEPYAALLASGIP